MSASRVLAFICVLVSVFALNSALGPKRKFEYKYSFKGPHLIQRDGSIPFWEHGGDAIASAESIRINPSLKNKKGWVWTRQKTTFEQWEIQVSFRVSGRGRIGADGLAVWFTEEVGTNGRVFGGADKWKGLGLFFDSFDNDGQHNNPYVMAMVNDGNQVYDHYSDGIHQQLGGCLRDFRNKPYPVRVKVEYYKNALSVWYNSGMTNVPDNFELCLRAENVHLPASGYFGISAATGGLADDHDALSFLTTSLSEELSEKTGQEVSEEQRKKYEEEFDEYYKNLEKAKEDFKKDHPDQVKKEDPYDEDVDNWFEEQGQRELKQIFEGQQTISTTIRDLHQKLDEVVGRQERMLSQISLVSTGGGQQPPVGQVASSDGIKRHEIDQMVNSQAQVSRLIEDIKTVLNEVNHKTSSMQGGQAGGQKAYNQDLLSHEVKDRLNTLDESMGILLKRPVPMASPPCPPMPAVNCLNTLYFVVLLTVQTVLFIGYMMYKGRQEAQAKKFF